MEKKMTYVEALETAINLVYAVRNGVAYDATTDLDMVVERLTALKSSTENRNNSVSKKDIARRKANDELAQVVLEVLATCDEPITITEMMALDSRFSALNVQRISPIMRKLIESNQVVRTESKHKAYFAKAVAVEG